MAFLRKILQIKPELKSEDIPLKQEQVDLGEGLALIFPTGQGEYRLCSFQKIEYCGKEFTGSKILEHNAAIRLPNGQIYLFKDDESQVAWREKIEAIIICTELESQFAPETLKALKAKYLDEYLDKGKHEESVEQLAARLVYYTRKKWKFERAIFYTFDGQKAVPLVAKAPEKEYKTSMKILLQAYKTKGPVKFNLKESACSSLSIIENKVQIAFCSPIFSQGKAVALFYADAGKKVHDYAMIGLAYLCSDFGHRWGKLREMTELKTIDLEAENGREETENI
jgi:hypothetical protein